MICHYQGKAHRPVRSRMPSLLWRTGGLDWLDAENKRGRKSKTQRKGEGRNFSPILAALARNLAMGLLLERSIWESTRRKGERPEERSHGDGLGRAGSRKRAKSPPEALSCLGRLDGLCFGGLVFLADSPVVLAAFLAEHRVVRGRCQVLLWNGRAELCLW